MKYFKKQKHFEKTAGEISDMIDRKAWTENPLFQTEGFRKLNEALTEIERRKPLSPDKNPDTKLTYLL
jgi:hypothetical protein